MSRSAFFPLTENKLTEYNGSCGNASYAWLLPGIICPACKATWGAGSKSYPSVDLTLVEALADFPKAVGRRGVGEGGGPGRSHG